jgi:hypothetical protein
MPQTVLLLLHFNHKLILIFLFSQIIDQSLAKGAKALLIKRKVFLIFNHKKIKNRSLYDLQINNLLMLFAYYYY